MHPVLKAQARRFAAQMAARPSSHEGTGLFIRVPPQIAPSVEDAHITFLWTGEDVDLYSLETVAKRVLQSRLRRSVWAELGPLSYFTHPSKDRRVAFVPVQFNAPMAEIRDQIKSELEDLGIRLKDKFPIYRPHVTLAYLDGLYTPYEGAVPTGGWDVSSMEVWGGTTEKPIPFVASRPVAAKTFTLNIGDPVLYGKFKNAKGWIVEFTTKKGEPAVVIESNPGKDGKTKKKTLNLFQVRYDKSREKKARKVAPIGWWDKLSPNHPPYGNTTLDSQGIPLKDASILLQSLPAYGQSMSALPRGGGEEEVRWHKQLCDVLQRHTDRRIETDGRAHDTLRFIRDRAERTQDNFEERYAARYKNKKDVPKAKGKGTTTVYEYSERQVQLRNREKAKRVEKLRKSIGDLRSQVREDLKSKDETKRLTALIVGLMDETYERVGNEESAKEGHFGVTGWKVKHVTFRGEEAQVKYVGKSGVSHNKSITDKSLIKALREAIKGKGEDDNLTGDVGPEEVNAYLKTYGVTAKDLRGYRANSEMQNRLKSIRSEGGKLPDGKKERDEKLKKEFEKALKETAKAVGHEPSTLKSQYLVPGLEDEYLKDGILSDSLNKKAMKVVRAWRAKSNPSELFRDYLSHVAYFSEAVKKGQHRDPKLLKTLEPAIAILRAVDQDSDMYGEASVIERYFLTGEGGDTVLSMLLALQKRLAQSVRPAPRKFKYHGLDIRNPEGLPESAVLSSLRGVDYLIALFKRKGMLKPLSSLRYVEIRREIRNAPVDRASGLYYHGAITLSSMALSGGPAGVMLKKWVHEIFLHEFGHHVHEALLHPEAKQVWDGLWDGQHGPTDYANTNNREGFAETFVAFMTNSPKLSEQAKYRMLKALSVSSLYGKSIMRFSTKDKSEREQGEVERLSRPKPTKKPPRDDLKRNRVKVDDPDLDSFGKAESDPDLSLNYKTV